jgi:hypothetical protein
MSIGARPEFPRPKDKNFEKSIMDYENPLALINLVSEDVRAAIEKIPASMLKLDEDEYVEKLGEPKVTVYQLRHQFWNEFDRACDTRSMMSMVNIYTACCSRTYWHAVIADPKALAFIMIPPAAYFAMTEELLARGLRRIRDILSLPIRRPNGDVDSRAGELILKSVMFLDMRIKGGFTHRTEQLSFNVNENRNAPADGKGLQVAGNPAKALDVQIEELEAMISQQQSKTSVAPSADSFMRQNHVIEVHAESVQDQQVEESSTDP